MTTLTLPRFATIPEWCRLSGMGRTVTYREAALGHLKMVKLGGRTLVDVQHGLKWLESLPVAKIKPQRRAA